MGKLNARGRGLILILILILGERQVADGYGIPLSKAGKGRSGTIACSYMIAECGWEPAPAMVRFTERRMRAGFGQGISIPSQLRWIDYVDRWTKEGKLYVERSVEILEVHIWGLRDGVKVALEGFVDDGRGIKTFHVFRPDERLIVAEGDPIQGRDATGAGAGAGAGAGDAINSTKKKGGKTTPTRTSMQLSSNVDDGIIITPTSTSTANSSTTDTTIIESTRNSSVPSSPLSAKTKMFQTPNPAPTSKENDEEARCSTGVEAGGMAVLFRPRSGTRIIIPTNDVNLAVERRTPISSRGPSSWQMVTAVAHVWFNTFWESEVGDRAEDVNQVQPSSSTSGKSGGHDNDVNEEEKAKTKVRDSGVFEIKWEAMDGIKGTSKRGTRALDRVAIVWKVAAVPEDGNTLSTPSSTTGSVDTSSAMRSETVVPLMSGSSSTRSSDHHRRHHHHRHRHRHPHRMDRQQSKQKEDINQRADRRSKQETSDNEEVVEQEEEDGDEEEEELHPIPAHPITSSEPVNEETIDNDDDHYHHQHDNNVKGLLPADLQGQGGSRLEAGDHGLLNRDVGVVLRGGTVSNPF